MIILEENQVNLFALTHHLEDSGLKVIKHNSDIDVPYLLFQSDLGLNFKIYLLKDRNFLQFATYLPLDQSRSYESKLHFLQKCNSDLFLTGFKLDDDDDLFVFYYMSFTHGIIIKQLIQVIKRFSRLIDYIVDDFDKNEMIQFSKSANEKNEQNEDHDEENSLTNTDSNKPTTPLLN